MKSGFRIEKLKILNHPVFRDNEFSFSAEDELDTHLYQSIIIGPNGTGKSVLLRIILDIFKGLCIDILSEKNFNPSFFFRLSFSSSGESFEYTNLKGENSSLIQLIQIGKTRYPKPKLFDSKNQLVTVIPKEVLPSQIIAQSIMLTDKFIVPRNDNDRKEFPIYKYLGLRNRPQQASTRSYVRRTVELIVQQMNSSHFQDGLKNMTRFLDLNDDIVVVFDTKYTTRFFKGNLTFEELDNYFTEIDNRYKKDEKIAPFKVGNYFSLKKKEKVGELIDFINSLVRENRLQDIFKSSVKHLNYHITISEDHKRLQRDFYYLDDLRKLGLLKAPNVKLSKKGINLDSVSSGEFHFFSTMVGLLATAEKNSLILMDEPEISLHPNWQMKYMNFINQAFSGEQYSGCQFIIATHSHFLISDLKPEQSCIIGLTKKKGKVQAVRMNEDTYGWSAEEVLYEIFNVKTTRNSYIEYELTELVDILNRNSTDKLNELAEILKKLSSLDLSSKDPLNVLIEKGYNYLKDNGYA